MPGLIVLVVFFGIPVFALIRISLSSWSGVGEIKWLGVDNFVATLSSSEFYAAILNSVKMAAAGTFGIVVIAVVLAALVSANIRGSAVYRVIWFLPGIAPAAALAVFWALSVQPQGGVVNYMLGKVGLGSNHQWLSTPSTALWVVVFVLIWHGVGFAFLLVLGAMEEIPVSVNEAASLDGASPVARFFLITLPLIRPVLGMITLLEVIWAFNGFTLVWAITRGGPGNATQVLPVLVFKEGFANGNFGPAAAISILGGLILLVIGFFSLRGQKSAED